MAAAFATAASSADERPRDEEDYAGTGFASEDEGEQSDSARSDSTRVPSVACLDNPKTRWADIMSDDDEPGACTPSSLKPLPSSKSLAKGGAAEQEAQGRGGAATKKAKRQRPKVWAEKKAVSGGTSSSSAWSQSTGDDQWWGQASYGGWDASWSEWWEPDTSYAFSHRATTAWARGEHSTAAASKWSRGGRGGNALSKKSQCQFLIGIEEDPKFHVVRRVLGPRGQHMKEIAEKTGAKLRLRGRGSNFLEGPEQLESTDPLMLCVSAPDCLAYDEAKRLTQELLEGVYEEYQAFCVKAGAAAPSLSISLHEGPREGAF